MSYATNDWKKNPKPPRKKHSKCKACYAFFQRFRCSAAELLECDCPKCQGYCSCPPSTEDLLATSQHEYRKFCSASAVYAQYCREAEGQESTRVDRSLKALLEQGKRFAAAFNAYMKSQESK